MISIVPCSNGSSPAIARPSALLPAPSSSRHPDDLAGTHGEVNVDQMIIGASPYDEGRSAGGFGGARRIEVGKVAADHGAHEPPGRRFRDRRGHHRPPVLQNGDAIRNRFDFRHSMGDIDDRHAFRAQALDEIEQTRRVIAIEGGGRLVHHEDTRVDGKSLCDLDELLLGDRQIARAGLRGDRRTEAGEQTLCVVAHLAPIEHAVARRLDAEKDVLRDAPMRQEAQLLMDNADTGAA